MSVAIQREIGRLKSKIDGSDIPYVLSAPSEQLNQQVDLVVHFPCQLDDANEDSFFQWACDQLDVYEQSNVQNRHLAMIIPKLSNSTHLTPNNCVNIFQLIDEAKESIRSCSDRIHLMGQAAGATKAILLAQWFPFLFTSIVISQPEWNNSHSSVLGKTKPYQWETHHQRMLSPAYLTGNLIGSSILMVNQHPTFWDTSIDEFGTNQMVDALHERDIDFQAIDYDPECISPETARYQQMESVWNWMENVSKKQPFQDAHENSIHRVDWTIPSYRFSQIPFARIRSFDQTQPANIVFEKKGNRFILDPQHVTSFDLEIPDGIQILQVGPDSFEIDVHANGRTTVNLQLADRWHLGESVDEIGFELSKNYTNSIQVDRSKTHMNFAKVKSSDRGGPCHDLLFGKIQIIYGTLGSESENGYLHDSARRLAESINQNQDSSVQIFSDVEYENRIDQVDSVIDHHATAKQLNERHVPINEVWIGTSSTNLQITKWITDLPIAWKNGSFQFQKKKYTHPEDLGFILLPKHDASLGYRLLLTFNKASALAALPDLPIFQFPDYLILRNQRVMQWGFWDFDWS